MSESDQTAENGLADAVLAGYLDRTDRGEKIDREQFLREHPDAASDLREFFDDLETINRALRPTEEANNGGLGETGGEFPRDFGSYVLLEKLGAGGMGQVYKAEHRHMQRLVAVKTLSPQSLDSPEAVERFRREVRAAARLSHPNVVTAHDAGEVGGVHFLAMEYVDGGDLSSLVARSGPLAVEQAVDYVIQAARGLEFAHQKRVIHRDVKPANLLLDREGTIKLLDLGLARMETALSALAATDSGSLTHSGQIMGTVDFMAPEQALDTKHAREPADIYSLGCTLFFLLTGRIIYPGNAIMERIIAHRERPVPSLREIRSDVPQSLDAVFGQMVAKTAEDRQGSMADLIAQLEACFPANLRRRRPWPFPPLGAEEADVGGPWSEAASGGECAEVPTVTLANDSSLSARAPVEAASDAPAPVRRQGQPRRKRTILVGTLVAAALASVAFAIVIKLQTRDGTLVLTLTEPGAQIEVLDEAGNVEIARRGEIGTLRISVDRGKHRLKVEKEGFQFYTKEFTIESGGVKEFEARLEPLPSTSTNRPGQSPPPAVAPFTPETARKHQERWAEHLGVPVEYENSIGMKMVLIPPGEFMMGSTREEINQFLAEGRNEHVLQQTFGNFLSEGPQHLVKITKPFYLGKYEVTSSQFRRFAEASGGTVNAEEEYNAAGSDEHPTVNVTWQEASRVCQWLNRQEEATYRLPTEAEWEYACRAGTTTPWSSGSDPSRLRVVANVADASLKAQDPSTQWAEPWDDGYAGVAPVGRFAPNPFGLYDMHGNVYEWCQDWYDHTYYGKSPTVDPQGPRSGTHHVKRSSGNLAIGITCRSAYRMAPSSGAASNVGFRLVREIVLVECATREAIPAGVNSALQFDGKSSYVEVPTLVYDGSHPVTMEATVTPFQVNDGVRPIVANTEVGGLGVFLNCGLVDSSQRYGFLFRDDRKEEHQGYRAVVSEAVAKVREPVHVAGVFDGRQTRLFVSGKRQKQTDELAGRHSISRLALMIGADPATFRGPEHFFNGMIDEVRVSSIARYDQDFTPCERFVPDEHTIALYHFDEREGDTAYDASGNGHHGKIVGAKWVKVEPHETARPSGTRQSEKASPPPAVAPFTPEEARQHQERWATHLGIPVEQEVNLADGVQLTMVLIPPGEFLMGSTAEEQARFLEEAKATEDQWAIDRMPSEGPQHRVRIVRPFRLSRHEVTRGLFRQFVERTGYKTEVERDGKGGFGYVDGKWIQDPRFVWSADLGFEQTDDHPVVNVSWNDAIAFCQWLSDKEGAEFVLPSEAQWEYACRAGTTTAWYCGQSDAQLQEYAWFGVNSGGKTHPVGELLANGFGLYDMHGNVWEWCSDWYAADYYAQSPADDPSGPSAGSHRVLRGGHWGLHAMRSRSACRCGHFPVSREGTTGFRLTSVLTDE